jgi:transcriptional regulator with XRE-family HTH domain
MAKKATKGPKGPTPEDVTLGKAIRTRRIEANMSQAQLGDALGLTFQQVQKYEKGTNRVSVTRLHVIAKALGEDVSYFLKGEGAPTSNLTALLTDSTSQRLLRAFHKITDPQARYKLVSLIEQMASAA